MRTRGYSLAVILLFLAITGSLLLLKKRVVRQLTLAPVFYGYSVYLLIVYAFLGIGLLAAFIPRIRLLKNKAIRLIYFVMLLPIAILPLFRCYFKIPFLFCRVCPRKCVFGYVRPVLVPLAVVTNLNARHFCYNICPIGKLQNAQASVNRKALRKSSLTVSIFSLIAVVYLIARNGFFKGIYSPTLGVVIASFVVLLSSFFISRLWCDNLCPIGGFARIYLKMKSIVIYKWNKRN